MRAIFKKSISTSLLALFVNIAFSQSNLTQFVNPFIGTGYHGHVFLGANVPFGAVQLGPTNMTQGWDWCSGYHYSDSTIVGFSHTHLSGTGIGDLGDILVMPYTGNIKLSKGTLQNPGYFSLFRHETETAKPGYYKVLLDRYNITAELTTSTRVGFHQYTFPKDTASHIIFDLVEGIGWDKPMDTYIKIINDTTIAGYRFSKGWANDQRIYFTAIFSKPFKGYSLWKGKTSTDGFVAMGDSVKAVLDFNTAAQEIIKVKVGISPVSMSNAMLNIQTEIPHWDFAKTVSEADNLWNKELGKVKVTTLNEEQKIVFYTSLYHTMFAPSVFNDVNGDYYGTDKQVYPNAKFTNYTTFSLWDTYRACHELYTVIQPKRASDMVNTMLMIYKQQGRLPIWHLMGNETNTMPGNSGIQVVVDACLKNIPGIDKELAFEAVKNTNMLDLHGLNYLKDRGYIPADSMAEAVAFGLEYAISDASIALLAKQLQKTEDYNYFSKRGGYYKNYFDPVTKFMRGRLSETEWRTPFDPFLSKHRRDDFAEGNAWQYTWMVPQDVEGLIKLLGGEKPFVTKLDSLFTIEGSMGEEASNDISGLIGQYAHGNEPSHHVTYLYSYAGQPWKTAEKVRFIMDSMYQNTPAGLIGNEDVGQMSAWYIWSSLGMYPVHPAAGMYVFGSPAVTEASIQLENGKTFTVIAKNNSPKNKYIQSVKLNGKNYPKSYLMHADLMQGGELVFEMGAKPSKSFGVKTGRPYSLK
ncbi:MAG: GH92 family glycosyl hydrolase [Niabella sp.]